MPRWLICLLLLPVLGVPALAADKFKEARAHYEEQIDRPPLTFRIDGMRRLAATNDKRALEILGRRYGKPRIPKEHERYLLARVLGEAFTDAQHVPALWRLVQRHKKDEHAWLWVNALGAAARTPEATDVRAAVQDARLKPLLRAAALEALAAQRHPQTLTLVADLLGAKLPRSKLARMALLESSARALLPWQDEVVTAEFKQAAGAVIDLLARDDVADRTRLVIARHLARVFNVERVTLEHQYWRRLLSIQDQPTHDGATVEARPRFFGLEATGSRLAYLIDLSDSMLDPVTKRELDDAKALHGDVDAKDGGIDWSRIRSRFDLARAFLVQSIRGLKSDVSFIVIAFGKEAEPLRSTKGLVRASSANVKKVVRELTEIEAGRTTDKRPHGTLRGSTNLHGALLRAFRATPKGLLDAEAHVEPELFDKGVDTVFVFSDGRPTDDDFDAQDRFDGGTVTTDREKGDTAKRGAGSANYFGPYIRWGNLLEDVRRLNTFRKAEIHTIAMGEADSRLLRGIAELGLGGYRPLGMLGRGGRINAWWLMGPYPAPTIESWSKAEAPEEGVALREPLVVGSKRVRWKRVFSRHKDAIINLDREFTPRDEVAAYAYAEIEVERAGAARLLLGSDDGARVWLNGKLVHTKLVKRGLTVDKDTIDVELVKGTNRLLVKVCDAKGPWRFCLRVTDPSGAAYPFLMR
ncbi:MAG: hypothetical protein QNJ98_13610 [Planctomycetota bacterium]|nr:hypothetical protein [Planctomycetota bacterium]